MIASSVALAKVCQDFLARVPGRTPFHVCLEQAIDALFVGKRDASMLVLGALLRTTPAVRERFFEALRLAVR